MRKPQVHIRHFDVLTLLNVGNLPLA